MNRETSRSHKSKFNLKNFLNRLKKDIDENMSRITTRVSNFLRSGGNTLLYIFFLLLSVIIIVLAIPFFIIRNFGISIQLKLAKMEEDSLEILGTLVFISLPIIHFSILFFLDYSTDDFQLFFLSFLDFLALVAWSWLIISTFRSYRTLREVHPPYGDGISHIALGWLILLFYAIPILIAYGSTLIFLYISSLFFSELMREFLLISNQNLNIVAGILVVLFYEKLSELVGLRFRIFIRKYRESRPHDSDSFFEGKVLEF